MRYGIFEKLQLNYLYFRIKAVVFKYNYLMPHTFEVLCNTADINLLACILNNSCHVLHKLLLLIELSCYSMRPWSHNRELPIFDYLTKKCFITRMLYK